MNYNPENPMIVQSDMTVLLETMGPLYEEARDFLCTFAELRKSPEYIHTYAITALSLWNAAAAGMSPKEIRIGLTRYAKYDVPMNVMVEVDDQMRKYGAVKLVNRDGCEILVFSNPLILREVIGSASVKKCVKKQLSPTELYIEPGQRGIIKHTLIKLGYPVDDIAGYATGDTIDIAFRDKGLYSALPFSLRDYQKECADVFTGSSVMVLPCGAGKTIVAMACMNIVKQKTLILTTNITALRQWRRELLDKTTLTEDQIGEYSGEIKQIKPVTLTTYQIMTYKKSKSANFLHMDLFCKENWGLIVYDEVHMLPAPVFRATTEMQAKRRLGLTATLVREDGCEDEVFSLIGPKRYDKPWKDLEKQGFIAKAMCMEIRLPMDEELRMKYASASLQQKYRVAMENPNKLKVMEALLKKHADDRVLIIGQYLDQLEMIRAKVGAPIITGDTPNAKREELYDNFKKGKIKVLIVSKVANFAVDLPDASVAIQMSGTYRSRQEESQRLGRVLRPKSGQNNAWFYSLVSLDTKDQECARNRSLFLTEQGYRYTIVVLDKKMLEQVDKNDFNFEKSGIVVDNHVSNKL